MQSKLVPLERTHQNEMNAQDQPRVHVPMKFNKNPENYNNHEQGKHDICKNEDCDVTNL